MRWTILGIGFAIITRRPSRLGPERRLSTCRLHLFVYRGGKKVYMQIAFVYLPAVYSSDWNFASLIPTHFRAMPASRFQYLALALQILYPVWADCEDTECLLQVERPGWFWSVCFWSPKVEYHAAWPCYLIPRKEMLSIRFLTMSGLCPSNFCSPAIFAQGVGPETDRQKTSGRDLRSCCDWGWRLRDSPKWLPQIPQEWWCFQTKPD